MDGDQVPEYGSFKTDAFAQEIIVYDSFLINGLDVWHRNYCKRLESRLCLFQHGLDIPTRPKVHHHALSANKKPV